MLLLIAILSVVTTTKCYNIDTNHPLVYKFPRHGDRSSYFGWTVALRPGASSLNSSWVVQIGAPRGNVTGVNVKEPGSVYRCQLHGPCRLFVVDYKGNTLGLNYLYHYTDRKDEGWTGVSMDIKSADATKTVVCGSRWSNQNLQNDDNIRVTYLMTGVCYLQEVCNCTMENPTYKLLPLVNREKIYFPKPYDPRKSYYYWGLGQAGMSVAILDDLSYVLLGAPGYSNWLGTVIMYNTDVRKYDYRVGLFEYIKGRKSNSYPYIGYQVSFGRFFGDNRLWLLTGAPRAENYHGKVILFQFKESNSQIVVGSELKGITFGEYFGSALAVLDINNDGHDDLIVGAPLFFRKHPEEGRIYVYLGRNRGNFLFRSQVINGRNGYSRFGSTISNLEDLDQDGFRDVAVGAPYENDGRGAVYIYKGCKTGLEMEYSQRIPAQEIHLGLRGFGVSISRGEDIDGNNYNGDIAIGAYLSDEVVILRSRPIIYLHPMMRLEEATFIDRKADHFKINICSRYTGSNAPRNLEIYRTVEVDAKRNRAYIKRTGSPLLKDVVQLNLHEMKCEVFAIMIKLNSVSHEPIQVALKTELPSCRVNRSGALYVWNNDVTSRDSFDKWCPIGRKKEAVIEVPFAGECGADNICQAQLQLLCEIPDIKKAAYVVGTSESMILSLELRNAGEPAHSTEIDIESNLNLISRDFPDVYGEPLTGRHFRIDVGSTFVNHFRSNFSFAISTDSITTNKWENTHLKLKAKAVTKSQDFSDDNVCDMMINLLSDSTVDLFSSPTVTSSFELKNTTELNFTLYYEVRKTGGTPVSDAELNIYIPSYIEDNLSEVEFTTVKVEASEWTYSSINDEDYKKWGRPSEVDVVWDNLNSSNASLPQDRTVFLNCSSHGIRCRAVSVVFPEGIPSDVSTHIKIFITLNVEALGSLLSGKDIIHFTSAGIVEYKKLFEREPLQIVSQSSATFYKEEEPKKVEPYVIALSVTAGGVLLFVITSALVKYEFFRRRKKEELQALKSEELRRQSALEFPPEIVDECNTDRKE